MGSGELYRVAARATIFVQLEEFPFFFCELCKRAVLSDETNQHVKNNHPKLPKEMVQAMREQIAAAPPGLIRSQEQLRLYYTLPATLREAVPVCEAARTDGMKCLSCGYICCSMDRMRRHQREQHGGQRDHGQEQEREQAAVAAGGLAKQRPRRWVDNVHCQRLFVNRSHSSYVEIQAAPSTANGPGEQQRQRQRPRAAEALVTDIMEQARQLFKAGQQLGAVIETDQAKSEPNAWLQRVGWAQHLAGLDATKLRGLQDGPGSRPRPGDGKAKKWKGGQGEERGEDDDDGREEALLEALLESLHRTMDTARQRSRRTVVGHQALFEINRRDTSAKARTPFSADMEDNTWARYKATWATLLRIIYRSEQLDEAERPPYHMTDDQRQAWHQWLKAAQAQAQHDWCVRTKKMARAMYIGESKQLELSSGILPSRQSSPSLASSPIWSSGDDSDLTLCSLDNTEDELATARVDRLGLKAMLAFISQELQDEEYENVLLSAMAVLGIEKDGSWCTALNYTPKMSAIIKIARMMALSSAHETRQREVRQWIAYEGGSYDEARRKVRSTFDIVRGMTMRFMTRVGRERTSRPTAMDWILEARTYGLYIRFNTTASPTIDWVGEDVRFMQYRFSMVQLTAMLHGMIREAEQLLRQLVLFDDSSEDDGADSESAKQALPTIPWSEVQDDHSDHRIGYWFMEDPGNDRWLKAYTELITQNMLGNKRQRTAWFTERRTGSAELKKGMLADYHGRFERFREVLWCLMHMTSGQPARATEILGLRFKNTRNGSLRNIMISHGQVGFVTAYHKSFRQTNEAKVIHRFLPRAVGNLLVWYFWLVLPFWQHMQASLKGAQLPSAFLWGQETVSRPTSTNRHGTNRSDGDIDKGHGYNRFRGEAEEEEEEEEGNGRGRGDSLVISEYESMSGSWGDFFKEPKWTSDRLRRIMHGYTKRYLGCPIGIAAWRHIAISIGRKYLGGKSCTEMLSEDDALEDEDGIDDQPIDLQAGHGSHVAGMVYGRSFNESTNGTIDMREKFRQISMEWHALFGLGPQASSSSSSIRLAARKRKARDEEQTQQKRQRLDQARQADLTAELRTMIGPDASFRGRQRDVVELVISGARQILYIAGTGEGKSLSFMLPAFCGRGGTTIVIVPMLALQSDLQERCSRLNIDSCIWKAHRGIPQATIVFTTPESACTSLFRAFVEVLRDRMLLDRVVVDECHMLINDGQFRGKFTEIGPLIAQWGVPRLFLTATLEPERADELMEVSGLSKASCQVIRSGTGRKNICYNVRYKEKGSSLLSKSIVRMLEEIRKRVRAKGAQSKMIIYTSSISQVEEIGAVLGCAIYHSKIGNSLEKSNVLSCWQQQGGAIAATNALGVGIDLLDIIAVIHIGMPRRLSDFIQESGRAGRNGKTSYSYVVTHPLDNASIQAGWQQSAVDYVHADGCRRAVLSLAMDGIERGSCGDGESRCDQCQGEAQRPEKLQRSGQENSYQATAIEAREEVARRRVVDNASFQDRVGEAVSAQALEQALRSWSSGCISCRLQGQEHAAGQDSCKARNAMLIACAELERSVFGNRKLERYTGCFWCGVPQALCAKWVARDGDGHSFSQQAGGQCQYSGLLRDFIGMATALWPGLLRQKTNCEPGTEAYYQWMGKKVQSLGGMQSNRMCRLFLEIAEELDRS